MLIDAYPDAKCEHYTCTKCKKKCGAIVNDKYCIKCFKEIKNE